MSPTKHSNSYSPFLLVVTILAGVVMVYGLARTGDISFRLPSLPKFVALSPPPPKQVLDTKPFGIVTNYPKLNDNDHLRGAKNAPYKIIAYIDYDCEMCRDFYREVRKVIDEQSKDIALVVRHFPLDINPRARARAMRAECIAQQEGEEAFWSYTDAMMTNPPLNDESADERCGKNAEIERRLRADSESAGSYGIGGVPALYIVNIKARKAVFATGMLTSKELYQLVRKIP